MSSHPSPYVAYVDESLPNPDQGPAAYVLAAAVVEAGACNNVRDSVRQLRVSGPRFHWRTERAASKRHAIEVIATQPALHVVVVGTPLAHQKPERARRFCLERLLFELDRADVTEVFLEARAPASNRRDIEVVDAFRAKGSIARHLRIDHARPEGPNSEELLWVPDAIAGAIGAAMKNEPEYLAQVQHLIERHEIKLS